MVNLEAVSPCHDLLPLTIGTTSLTETILPDGQVWSRSPSPVAPGSSKTSKSSRTLWVGRDHALQIGGARPKSGAVTDQSDAWACVLVSGDDAMAVLARLCPIDLRLLKEGEVLRTLINHMTAIVSTTSTGIEIMVFRAFARTLVHELEAAARAVEARKQIGL